MLLTAANQADIALGGALLIELALVQRVDVAAEDGIVRKGRLIVSGTTTTADSLLDDALTELATRQRQRSR